MGSVGLWYQHGVFAYRTALILADATVNEIPGLELLVTCTQMHEQVLAIAVGIINVDEAERVKILL